MGSFAPRVLRGTRLHRTALWAVVVALGASLLSPVAAASAAEPTGSKAVPAAVDALAVNASDFDPGLIISDDLFYDGNAMTAQQIQAFLDSKIGTCLNGNCLNVATIPYPGRARDISSTTGNLVCEAISSGTMRVSELIYRVQVACGISAKVILVTLQKEQGLVTKRAPGDGELRWAMGMACPDTAPCDTAFAGLGTQIVAGTRQLKAYKASAFARQPGTHFIQWNPNSACSGTYVNIRNYATAALYNYTPYQPNAAALGNMYGTGDGCSSYGNRNFWSYYNDWFGSTVETDPTSSIEAVYLAMGGASGVLGARVANPTCSVTRPCVWTYVGGAIAWSKRNSAVPVVGVIAAAWLADTNAYGMPVSPETAVTDPNGNGTAQTFERGVVHASVAGTFIVPNGTMPAYSAAGWLRGQRGWPTSSPMCGGGSSGCLQTFQWGWVTQSADGEGTFMRADIEAIYRAAGAQTGSLGYPTGIQTGVTDPNGNGIAQGFTGGIVHAGPSGAFVVPSSIMPAYSRAGWLRGPLGWPKSDYACDVNGCGQTFAGGTIRTATDGSGAFVVPEVDPAIEAAYRAAGGETGFLGYASSVPNVVKDPNGNGVAQSFAGGIVHAGPAGAFAVPNSIMTAYSKAGWLRGSLGWPKADYACDTNGCGQAFAGGTIRTALDGTGAFVVAPVDAAIIDAYRAAGAETGFLGYPLSPASSVKDPNGNGVAQSFAGGIVHAGPAGAFAVPNSIMTTYSAKGWLRGSLGWPAADAVCDSAGCTQEFAGGTIVAPTGQSGYVVVSVTYPAIRDLFDSTGGASGTFGYPTSPHTVVTDRNGDGVAQVFQNGVVHASSAGAYFVPNSVMPAYSARGWVRGSLAWPAGEAVCDANGCVQQFQNGTIDTH